MPKCAPISASECWQRKTPCGKSQEDTIPLYAAPHSPWQRVGSMADVEDGVLVDLLMFSEGETLGAADICCGCLTDPRRHSGSYQEVESLQVTRY